MFVDEIKVYARAGHGGRGAVAFRREAYIAKGGPDGGNGGKGGDVILEASHDLNNLIEQYFNPRLIAQHGEGGMGKGMDGKAGKDIVIKVPCGTMVWRIQDTTPNLAALPKRIGPSGAPIEAEPSKSKATLRPAQHPQPLATSADEESSDERPVLGASASKRPVIRSHGGIRAMEIDLSKESDSVEDAFDAEKGDLVCDLTTHGQRFVLCKGGRGGLGNRNFATSRHQTPRFAQPGEPGTEGEYLLELRIVADVGIVGYPNAGKSTLLTAISHARPKIAPYPFTTLTPQVGIVEYEDFARLVVCDVPGLIEGAHRNVGLGHAFLRHLRRCKVLVLLLDMAGTDNRPPWEDHRHLLGELGAYDPSLLERPRIVVANKVDEPQAEANLKAFKRKVRKTPVLPISAAFGDGMDAFKQAIRDAVEEVSGPLQR